jgi:hypothetical protein
MKWVKRAGVFLKNNINEMGDKKHARGGSRTSMGGHSSWEQLISTLPNRGAEGSYANP